ncbi:MAG: hypothetical protein ABII72_00160 [Parcubacteria group bacterium]
MSKNIVVLLALVIAGCGAPLQSTKSGRTERVRPIKAPAAKISKGPFIHDTHQWKELPAPERDKLLREYGSCLYGDRISKSRRCKKVEWIVEGWGWIREVRPRRVARKTPTGKVPQRICARSCHNSYCPFHKRVSTLMLALAPHPWDIRRMKAMKASLDLLRWCRGWFHLEQKLWGKTIDIGLSEYAPSPGSRLRPSLQIPSKKKWWGKFTYKHPSMPGRYQVEKANLALAGFLTLLYVKRHWSHFCGQEETVKKWAKMAMETILVTGGQKYTLEDPFFLLNSHLDILARLAWIHQEFLKKGKNKYALALYSRHWRGSSYMRAARLACMHSLGKNKLESAIAGMKDSKKSRGWRKWVKRARQEMAKTGSCHNTGWGRYPDRDEIPPQINPQSIVLEPF